MTGFSDRPEASPRSFDRHLAPQRKFRLETPITWPHHFRGWRDVVDAVRDNLCTDTGMLFVGAVEDHLHSRGAIRENWVGILHQVPHHRLDSADLTRLMDLKAWRESLGFCRGLWVLSEYQRQYLLGRGLKVPIGVVPHPVAASQQPFSPQRFLAASQRQLYFIGVHLRDWQAFYDLDARGYQKHLLGNAAFERDKPSLNRNDSVVIRDRVSNDDYEKILSEHIVFVRFHDAAAVNTVLECISACTPLLTNRVGAIAEYLGDRYPLYYDSLAEAESKLGNDSLILEAHDYLKTVARPRLLSPHDFVVALQNTAIYRALPNAEIPPPFTRCAVTAVLCSHSRIQTLEEVLEGFARQDFQQPWELFLWNNNPETWPEVERISKRYADRLQLTLIQSSQNFYCMARLSIIPLMKSDILMFCDDDVVPQPSYLTTFMASYDRLGPDAAICARGQLFAPHALDEERPHLSWQSDDKIKFRGENDDECLVHFMHANSCLIPAALLRRAMQIPMPEPQWALVDDYWLSFVLSHHMNIPLWKIRADAALRFLPSSEDTSVALYRRRDVIEQKINFYIHHMRQGWPPRPGTTGAAAPA
jgi:glycosyl transferase family 2